jgi:hypothetical protein
MSGINNFPMNQYHYRSKEQAPTKEISNKQHWCEHHKMSPIINSAIDTAFVFHNECLERTEKQNADVIAQKIKNSQHQQVRIINHMEQIQKAKDSIK